MYVCICVCVYIYIYVYPIITCVLHLQYSVCMLHYIILYNILYYTPTEIANTCFLQTW